MALTKAQNRSSEIIEDFLESREKTLSWETIVSKVRENHSPRNWMPIRGVLQFYLNEGHIIRTRDLHVEEYVKA